MSSWFDDEDDTFLLFEPFVPTQLRVGPSDLSLNPEVTWGAAAVRKGGLLPEDGQVMVLGMFDVPAPAENPVGLKVIETAADNLCGGKFPPWLNRLRE